MFSFRVSVNLVSFACICFEYERYRASALLCSATLALVRSVSHSRAPSRVSQSRAAPASIAEVRFAPHNPCRDTGVQQVSLASNFREFAKRRRSSASCWQGRRHGCQARQWDRLNTMSYLQAQIMWFASQALRLDCIPSNQQRKQEYPKAYLKANTSRSCELKSRQCPG